MKLSPALSGHAHLTLCIGADGELAFFPEGDPEQIERGLRRMLRIFRDHPDAVRCAAGTCDGSCSHGG